LSYLVTIYNIEKLLFLLIHNNDLKKYPLNCRRFLSTRMDDAQAPHRFGTLVTSSRSLAKQLPLLHTTSDKPLAPNM
jgi:hypothetical protein